MCPVRILQVIYCFVWVLISVRFYNAQKEPSCGRAKNCNECMGIRPVCSWCSADEFDDTKEGPGFRCAPSSVLLARGCPKDSIEDVESVVLGESFGLYANLTIAGHLYMHRLFPLDYVEVQCLALTF
ncbi:Integrin beta isoform 1 [Schistosoma japonicum]|uniref:Integrin beta isoform 1 n=1 Tax=Schistosoma japonicum TaxID=6182 RepID=A0A4Z2CX61_SCHJA|nr:Integrin beta isoform 1 [Schistosoma japonicum]